MCFFDFFCTFLFGEVIVNKIEKVKDGSRR